MSDDKKQWRALMKAGRSASRVSSSMRGDTQLVRAAIRRASHGDPVDEAHFNLALVLRAEGKYAQARSSYKAR